jgi:hypothetical protein
MTAHARPPQQPAVAQLGSVPRDVALTTQGRVLAGFAVSLVLASLTSAVVLTMLHVRQARDRELRASATVYTEADVVNLTRTRGEHPRRVVTYEFAALDGTVHYATARLDGRDPLPMASDRTIYIGYLRSDPERSWVSGHEPEVIPVWVPPLVSRAVAGFAWLVIWRLRRDWTLLEEGRAAAARVVATKKVARQHHRATRVDYEFTTLAGATVRGHAELGRRPPAEGDRVTVVYHRDDPHWNALYPLTLVRSARK